MSIFPQSQMTTGPLITLLMHRETNSHTVKTEIIVFVKASRMRHSPQVHQLSLEAFTFQAVQYSHVVFQADLGSHHIGSSTSHFKSKMLLRACF